jgi:hypothetical protein
MRIAWRTVGRICERVAVEAKAGRDLYANLTKLGFDEISIRKGQKYLTVVVDHHTGRLVWAHAGRDRKTVEKFLDLVYHESCVELAGESPATVMTKQPCSWWAVVGETRMPKPHDKVALGGEQARGPYDEESCASAVRNPARTGNSGSRASQIKAKAMEGAKSLDVQHRGTRRRSGIGTCAQFGTERERSVSAPATMASGRQPGVLREVARPITGSPGKWWSAERKSEEVVLAMIGVDNITRRSEGPLARWAITQRPRPLCGRGASQVAGAGRQHLWRGGMRPVDCLGESRVRENLTHGSGRGAGNGACPVHGDGLSPRRETPR